MECNFISIRESGGSLASMDKLLIGAVVKAPSKGNVESLVVDGFKFLEVGFSASSRYEAAVDKF